MTLEQLKKMKEQTGLSCEQISARSGVPLSTVQKVLAGVTRNPRYKTLQALEKAFVLNPKNNAGPVISGEECYDAALPDTKASSVNIVADTRTPYAEGSSAFKKPLQARYNRQGTYTVEDYLALPKDQRVELIDGVFYDMAAPLTVHQAICFLLTMAFGNFIDENNGSCAVLPSPIDVQLDEDDRTMVEPDICIVCDKSKLHRERIYGAPDMIIEILSESTKKKDLTLKTWKYSNAGVREYWIIDPEQHTVIVFDFEHNFAVRNYTFNDSVPVGIYDGKLAIDFRALWVKVRERYGLS